MRAETVNIVRGRIAGAAGAGWHGHPLGMAVIDDATAKLRLTVPPAVVVLAAILIQCLPAAQAALQFDRHAVEAGQVWRVLTCHLTH